MSKSTWTGAVNSDWDNAGNWSPAGVPDADSDVVIASGTLLALASASIGTVNSITDSSHLSFGSAGTNTVTTFLDDTRHLYVDTKRGDGGTILNIGGTLTNSGTLSIGNATLSASDEVTAATLGNTGSIALSGSSTNQALLGVAGSAGFGTAGVLSGNVQLSDDSAIEFASGQITSLAAGAHLVLNGNDAFIEDSTAPGSNSALKGLASISAGATLDIHNKAAVSTTGLLVNDGHIRLDIDGGDGGSSLTVGGVLTNSGSDYLSIGNDALSASDKVTAASLDSTGLIHLQGFRANQALLDVTGAAGFGTAGTLTGSVRLYHTSAIEFLGGQITTIGASSTLSLTGNTAFIEDSTALGSNSALTGLSDIAGSLDLAYGASVSTTGPVTNNGAISIIDDTEEFAGADSGTGSFNLITRSSDETANLQFDSNVSSGQTINETGDGADALILEQAQNFAATISGFGTGDTIDATNFLAPPSTTYNFVENIAGTGGTLTLHDASLIANILMTGLYTKSDFTLAPDHGTGTLVKFV
jgi:hypothetical protein